MDNPAEEAERLRQLLAAIVRAYDGNGDIKPLIWKAREETQPPEVEPTTQPVEE